MTTGRIFGDLMTFGLFVTLSRMFGQEGIGKYSFAIAFTGMFAILSELGANSYTVRELSRSSQSFAEVYGRILSLRAVLAVLVSGLLLIALPFLPFPSETLLIVALIGGYQIAYQLVMSFACVFLARGQPLLAGGVEGGFKAATALVAMGVAWAGGGLLLSVATLPVVAGSAVAIGYRLVRRHEGPTHWSWSRAQLMATVREVLPYGVGTLFGQLQVRLDVTLLGFLLGAAAAGVYNVGYRPVFFMLFLPYFVGMSVLPLASRLHERSTAELSKLYRSSLNLVVLVGFPVAGGLVLIADDLIRLLFGAEFADSAPLLSVLAWLIFLGGPRTLLGMFLVATGRQKERAQALGAAVVAGVVLNLILIPRYGPMGAACATVGTEALLISLMALRLWPLLGAPRVGSRFLIGGLATAAFFALFKILSPQPMFVVIPSCVALYAIAILSFPQIRRDELQLVRGILRARGERARLGEAPL